jgi:hypothetical protein
MPTRFRYNGKRPASQGCVDTDYVFQGYVWQRVVGYEIKWAAANFS